MTLKNKHGKRILVPKACLLSESIVDLFVVIHVKIKQPLCNKSCVTTKLTCTENSRMRPGDSVLIS